MSDNRNILVVEGDEDTRRRLPDLLESEGYRVKLARSGHQALVGDHFADFKSVFLDGSLLNGDAGALLREIKRTAPATTVVVLTDRHDGHADIAVQQGAVDFLDKPVQPLAVRALLRRLGHLQDAQRRASDAERRATDAERRAEEAERLADIGQMAAVLAHEARGELHQLAICLALLRRSDCSDAEFSEIVALADKARGDLARLFEDLRCHGGGLALHRQRLDLQDTWRKAWAKVESRRDGRRVELVEYTGGVDTSCWGDGFRLEQAFRNLFENALEACPDPVRIDVCCSRVTAGGKPALRTVVRDNGPGMTEEQRQKAFDPCYTTKSQGTGLGLAIAKRIFEAHRGSIKIRPSHPGAEFIIRLPVAPQ